MESAAKIHEQLMTMLGPYFETVNSAIKDIKKELGVINDKLQEIHDQALITTTDIAALDEKIKAHELRIASLEDSTRINADGVNEYKRTKAFCIATVGVLAGLLTTFATWGLSTYIEGIRHKEEMEIRQIESAKYDLVCKELEVLKKAIKKDTK